MLRNFIAEIIHATTKIVSPKGEFEGLKTDELNVRTLRVSDTAEVKNKLTVVEETKTKTLTVDNDATIKHDITVENNVTVKKKLTVETQADVTDLLVTAVNKDSKAWGSDEEGMPLVTDAREYPAGFDDNRKRGNVISRGTNPKLARVDHTHSIPNAIKNPNPIKIYNFKGILKAEYDGSEERTLTIDHVLAGAAPKVHTSSSGAAYGQATDELFGHVKLYTAGSLVDDNGDLDESDNGPMKALDTKGLTSGFALTPASLASYARYERDYVKNNFLPVPKDPEADLSITRNLVVDGLFTANGKIKVKNSAYLDGSSSTTSDNILQLYGVGRSDIGMLQFGKSPVPSDDDKKVKTILTSNGDGHLYIDNGNGKYLSKLTDYEVEAVITSNSNKQFKVWYPARDGYYRIYMIGGGGIGAAGTVIKDDKAPWASVNHDSDNESGPPMGYGTGYAYGGAGGGGGPVVIIDIETQQPASIVSDTDDIVECGANEMTYEYEAGKDSLTANGDVSIVMPEEGKFSSSSANIVIKIESVNKGLYVSRNKDSDNPDLPKFVNAEVIGCTIEDIEVSGINIENLKPEKKTIDGAINYVVTAENETLTLTDVLINVTARLSCTDTGFDSSVSYAFPLTISKLTINVSPWVEEDDGGARFVFLKAKRKGVTADGVVKNYDGTYCRCVGVQRLRSVGKVVNIDEDVGDSSGLSWEYLNKTLGIADVYNSDNVNPSPKAIIFDALVGHGEDYTATTERNTWNGSVESVLEGYSHFVTKEGNILTNYCYGGSSHHEGSNGYTYFGGEPVDNLSIKNASANRKKMSAWRSPRSGGPYYSECDGYDGGVPGDIGITGVVGLKGTTGSTTATSAKKAVSLLPTTVFTTGGTGGTVSIAALDGYSLGVNHSDRSGASTQIKFPKVASSNKAGYGYYGGGHGGGGAVLAARGYAEEAVTSSVSKAQAKQYDVNINQPCVIIVYLGRKNKGGG